jgi:hypothetical protein
MDPRKRITQLVGFAIVAQLLAMVLVGSIWSVTLPPVLASVPTALLTMRSPETVREIAPKLRQHYVGVALLGCAVIGWFAWSGNDLSFDLQLLRAVFADVDILVSFNRRCASRCIRS